MPKKKKLSETDQLNQKLADSLKMPIVQQSEPSKGSTEFAKDNISKK